MREYYLKNMSGILYEKDTPLFRFVIKNRQLIEYEEFNNQDLYPPEIAVWGISYRNINEFFNRRVVREGAMFVREYLDVLGLEFYDFEEIVKRNNGSNRVDAYWVKFEKGAECWNDVCNQTEPLIL